MNVLLLTFLGVVSYTSLVYCASKCSEFKTCSECIGHASERCVWCAMNTMKNLTDKPNARCQPQSEVYKDGKLNTEWCLSKYTNNPGSKKPVVKENREFNATKGNIVQFRPQKMELTLRPGDPVTVDMYYRPAEQFPLDMYFLMDSSFTMDRYSKELADQTMKIYEELTKLTNNVQLGIGSFVEKPALPYADPKVHKTCHAFKNHLSLTKNLTLFQTIVNTYHSVTDANYDSPEAALDALIQVMTCEIGWRDPDKTKEQARRIIILATDATYHSAGDGKMVGAYKPNDMKCHLDPDMSLILDYPSVSQINYVAKQGKFIIVFAVLPKVWEPYTILIKEIDGAQLVKLQDNKIIQLIRDAYITASRNVKVIKKNDNPNYIKIETNCDKTDQCKSSEKEPVVHIQATITAMGCNNDSEIEIYPVGISDKLTIKVNIDCECPCEKDLVKDSEECNKHGNKLCGICKCRNEWSGEKCELECSAEMASETKKQCKMHDTDPGCNDQGDCVCGQCQCYNRNNVSFSGKFCQFNDATCRKKCPADKGDCVLGKCKCKDPTKWTGTYCDCPTSVKTCIGPFYRKPCSGRGVCSCGQCKCNSQKGNYFGKYCDSCKDCANELCELLKDYAFCNYENKTKAVCDTRFKQISVKTVTIMNTTALEAETSATGCRKTLENGKIIVYKYRMVIGDDDNETEQIELMIQDELVLPPVVNIWITIGSVIGGVLLVGLLTLIIWKFLTNMYDKREYDKFCKEAIDNGFDVSNPVYQDPNVNFVNPAYEAK